MSGKDKNMKNKLSDFLRYRRNEMSFKERNAFERELQKDPFAEEASEGFEGIYPGQAEDDINRLRKSLTQRISRKHRIIYYRIAASVAVLMIISSIFIVVEKTRLPEQISESVASAPLNEIPESLPQVKSSEKVRETPLLVTPSERKEERPVINQIQSEKVKEKIEIKKEEVTAENPDAVAISERTEPENAIAGERALAQKSALAKSDTDTSPRIRGKIVGYGGERTDEGEQYTPPQPASGKVSFDRYIDENINPDMLKEGQRAVVVISFRVRTTGEIDSIKVIRSPGKTFSDEAIRLLKEGPAWKPAIENGKTIEKEARIRIVFK